MCKVCSSLGQKWGNERAITGSNIILTCPLFFKCLKISRSKLLSENVQILLPSLRTSNMCRGSPCNLSTLEIQDRKFLASRSDAVTGSKGLPEIIKNTANVRQTKDGGWGQRVVDGEGVAVKDA